MGFSREPPPEISGGDTFQFSGQELDRHVWVVISDPLRDENHILIVNFTTCRPRSDKTCMIQPGEHGFVTAPTCVHYMGAYTVKLGILEGWLDSGRIALREPVSADLLGRIRQGAIDSPQTPYGVKQILIDQELVIPF